MTFKSWLTEQTHRWSKTWDNVWNTVNPVLGRIGNNFLKMGENVANAGINKLGNLASNVIGGGGGNNRYPL